MTRHDLNTQTIAAHYNNLRVTERSLLTGHSHQAWFDAAEITEDTVAIMMLAVMFKDSSIIPNLDIIADASVDKNIPLLVDAYHALNVLPFILKANNFEQAFIFGGGYKYCQFGEGNCFLRIPDDCKSRYY